MKVFIFEVFNSTNSKRLIRETRENFLINPFFKGWVGFEPIIGNKLRVYQKWEPKLMFSPPLFLFKLALKLNFKKYNYRGECKVYNKNEVEDFLFGKWDKSKL